MTDRSIDLFDIEHPIEKHRTTHVHAYVRAANGWYTLFVCPYTLDTAPGLDGVRRYPLSATKGQHIETCLRFNAKRLEALANDPHIASIARHLAGKE